MLIVISVFFVFVFVFVPMSWFLLSFLHTADFHCVFSYVYESYFEFGSVVCAIKSLSKKCI